MQANTLTLGDQTISYTLNTSPKLKRLSMRWARGTLTINQPRGVSDLMVQNFIYDKQSRILKQYHRSKNIQTDPNLSATSREHFLAHRSAALRCATSKVEQWANIIPYPYNTIRVKSLKTKRGSCSSKKNLNFSYKILRLPEHLQDYLVVHEMCHLHEMNHSHRFWSLVEKYYGPRKLARKQLRNY